MRSLEICQDIDLDGPGTATGTAIDLAASTKLLPFKAGNTVTAMGAVADYGENAEGKITLQGRETTSDSWVDLASWDTGPVRCFDIVLTRYLRYAVESVTAGDGRGSITLLGN